MGHHATSSNRRVWLHRIHDCFLQRRISSNCATSLSGNDKKCKYICPCFGSSFALSQPPLSINTNHICLISDVCVSCAINIISLKWCFTYWARNKMATILQTKFFRLTKTRRQAIIWTNDGPVYWHIYASPSLNSYFLPSLYVCLLFITIIRAIIII